MSGRQARDESSLGHEAVRLGIRAACINASGFADADADGVALQKRLNEAVERRAVS